MRAAAVLLAAGQSRRFGDEDKLTTLLDGLPLWRHAAKTLSAVPFATRIIVSSSPNLTCEGFRTVLNENPSKGVSSSIGLGVAEARCQNCDVVIVALADMPFVTVAHFQRLLQAYRDPASIAVSFDGENRAPPALFGADWFDALSQLSGDKGAKAFLETAMLVKAGQRELTDIDRPADLSWREI